MTLLALLLLAADPQPAPGFSLQNAAGYEIKLSKLKGKIVMVNFWATHCAPCVQEMPWLADFYQKYRRRNFTIVGISLDDDWSTVKAFLKQKPVPYNIVLGNDALSGRYHVEAMPFTALLDRQGRIVWTHTGLIDPQQTEREIQKLLRHH